MRPAKKQKKNDPGVKTRPNHTDRQYLGFRLYNKTATIEEAVARGWPKRRAQECQKMYKDWVENGGPGFLPHGRQCSFPVELTGVARAHFLLHLVFAESRSKKSNPLGKKDKVKVLSTLARYAMEERTGKDQRDRPDLCDKTVDRIMEWTELAVDWKKLERGTDARAAASWSPYKAVSEAVMLGYLLNRRGSNMLKHLVANIDAFSIELQTDDNTWCVVPHVLKDDFSLETKAGAATGTSGSISGKIGCKTYLLLSAAGTVLSVVTVVGDHSIKAGLTPIKIPLKGYGPHKTYPGWLCVSHQTHPTVDFHKWMLLNVIIPAFVAERNDCKQRDPNLQEFCLLLSDGEYEFIKALEDPEVRAALDQAGISAMKHSSSCSAFVQLNDVSSVHRTVKKMAKSGSQAVFADVQFCARAADAFDKAAKDFQATEEGKDWKPSNVRKRLLYIAKHLPPIFQAGITASSITKGAEACGFALDPEDVGCGLRDSALIKQFEWGKSLSSSKMSAVLEVIRKCREEVKENNLTEITMQAMDEAGLKGLLSEEQRMSFWKCGGETKIMDEMVVNHRGAIFINHHDEEAHQKRVKEHMEALRAEVKEKARLLKRARKDEEQRQREDKRLAVAAAIEQAAVVGQLFGEPDSDEDDTVVCVVCGQWRSEWKDDELLASLKWKSCKEPNCGFEACGYCSRLFARHKANKHFKANKHGKK